MIASGVSSRNPMIEQLRLSESLINQGASLRRTGSTALDLAYVASGRLDGICIFGAPSWDLAAGSLLIQEAGGLISDRRGGEDFLKQGDVIAGTPKVFKALLQTCEGVLVSSI